MKLRTRISIAAIATAAAAGATGTFLLPAASARTAPHTLTFTSVQQATTTFSPTVGASEDKDVSKAGKIIGYDVLRFSFNPKTNTTSIGAAVDLNGGFLYGVMRESDGPVTRGTVTGGTGTYRGATGTITAKALGQDGTKTAVTITYRT
jgi:hypothetical protein